MGDVHYPSATSDIGADSDGIPDANVRTITSPRLKTVMEKIAELKSRDSVLVLSGDLTDRGNLDGYRQAVERLNQVLRFVEQPERLIAVPGNHDIRRDLVKPGEDDLFRKFTEIKDIWTANVQDVFSPSDLRVIELAPAKRRLPAVSLNTCILCWEYRNIPGYWHSRAVEALSEILEEDAADEMAAQLRLLQVDSPSIFKPHLDELERLIGEDLLACIVVGHHALLPQARPRLNINGEPLNAGLARHALLRGKTPVVYLHGHLHDDPIECLSNPAEGHYLLCIGAPELSDGFNEITLYSSSEDTFLGVDIAEYRFRAEHLELRNRRRLKFPQLGRERVESLKRLARLVDVGSTVTVQELRVAISNSGLHSVFDMSDEAIRDAIVEADWLDLLNVDEKGAGDLAEWRISA